MIQRATTARLAPVYIPEQSSRWSCATQRAVPPLLLFPRGHACSSLRTISPIRRELPSMSFPVEGHNMIRCPMWLPHPLGVELPWSPEPIMCSFRSRKALKQPPFSVHVQWPGDFHRKAMDLAVIASLLLREQRVSERLVALSHPVPVPFLVASGHFSW